MVSFHLECYLQRLKNIWGDQTSQAQYMFQYFVKVVSTQFSTLGGQVVNSHQYSVTHFERDLQAGMAGNTNEGLQIAHGVNGLPGECRAFGLSCLKLRERRGTDPPQLSVAGVFFSYEISPILVAHRETRQSFAHFLTSYATFTFFLVQKYVLS